MRPREVIECEVKRFPITDRDAQRVNQLTTIEVLLDIRDLLAQWLLKLS